MTFFFLRTRCTGCLCSTLQGVIDKDEDAQQLFHARVRATAGLVKLEEALAFIDSLDDEDENEDPTLAWDVERFDSTVFNDQEPGSEHAGAYEEGSDRREPRASWWSRGDSRDVERLCDSLPFWCPPGYERDARGAWRYSTTRARVPGARDRTLASTWRVRRHGQHAVSLPRVRVRTQLELEWMTEVEIETDDPTIVAVDKTLWAELSRRSLGIDAPELSCEKLWDTDNVAAFLGVKPGTIWSYVARKAFPEPVTKVGRTSVWSEPLVLEWYVSRPGQGSRSDLARRRASANGGNRGEMTSS